MYRQQKRHALQTTMPVFRVKMFRAETCVQTHIIFTMDIVRTVPVIIHPHIAQVQVFRDTLVITAELAVRSPVADSVQVFLLVILQKPLMISATGVGHVIRADVLIPLRKVVLWQNAKEQRFTTRRVALLQDAPMLTRSRIPRIADIALPLHGIAMQTETDLKIPPLQHLLAPSRRDMFPEARTMIVMIQILQFIPA